MKNRLLILCSALLFTFFINLSADEFSQWKANEDAEFKNSQDEFIEWKKKEDLKFKEYLKAQDEAFKEYKKEIDKFWPTSEVTTTHKWVEYENDYSTKKSVNFYSGDIKLEVIADNEDEAKKKIEKLYMDLLGDSVKSAYSKDKLEDKILRKLNKPKQIYVSEEKIVSDILTEDDMKDMYKKVKMQKLQVVKYNGNRIYKANIKLPPTSMIRKAKTYASEVNKSSSKEEIPPELIYAIMHSESSFNPMARSHIPAFGLMQIVPTTAGIDSYIYLYGKRKVPSSNFLYDASKNITMGTAYLHILYYKYLKDIKDPMSKLFCVISAYNTGAGNVAKAFTGTTNIAKASVKINSMDSNSVYKHLMRNLPYNETRGYLKKVSDRTASYYSLIEKKEL